MSAVKACWNTWRQGYRYYYRAEAKKCLIKGEFPDMSEDNISQPGFALFHLGFRPFFLGASIYSVILMSVWTAIFAFNITLPISGLSVFQWHAHEMIFGYTLAVIAGFLLTAVKTWTGMQTLPGPMLVVVFGLWLVARLLFLTGTFYKILTASRVDGKFG